MREMPDCEQDHRARIAVLIDADNVSPEWTVSVLDQLAARWNPYFRRAYGASLGSKTETFRSCGIHAVAVFPNTKGKNATDHALIIDAMKELHRGHADAFCIVSGDADFTRLAQTLREAGKVVLAFGPAHTPLALRKACTEFYLLENEKTGERRSMKPKASEYGQLISDDFEILSDLLATVEGMSEMARTVTVASLSATVRMRDSGFSPSRHRAKSLTRLLRRLKVFDLKPRRSKEGSIADYEVSIIPGRPD